MKSLVAIVFGLALPLVVAAPRGVAEDPGPGPCIEVAAVTVWGGWGYNHIVYLTDRCDEPYACDVSTDVDPEIHHALVPGRTTVQVYTAVNSLARVIFPKVDCVLASK